MGYTLISWAKLDNNLNSPFHPKWASGQQTECHPASSLFLQWLVRIDPLHVRKRTIHPFINILDRLRKYLRIHANDSSPKKMVESETSGGICGIPKARTILINELRKHIIFKILFENDMKALFGKVRDCRSGHLRLEQNWKG